MSAGYLADTSVFVAAEQGRELGAPPDGEARISDAIIAATAVAHDLAVWTQDDDFDVLAELVPALAVHRG